MSDNRDSLGLQALPPSPLRWLSFVETAKEKLNECDEKHSCRSGDEDELPTRLLDLGRDASSPSIRLIETTKEQITDRRYAALTYCWGTSGHFTTQPSTLPQRLAGFAISSMPATLCQAVLVSRDLGIRYLWVDALCILQGHGDAIALADWKQESARMNIVYGNAYLTIAAAGSSRCAEGLVSKSTWNEPNRDLDKFDFGHEPLFGRAWAQQEWVLSTRLLVFTSMGIFFACNFCKVPAAHRSHKVRLSQMKASHRDLTEEWYVLLADFGARDLTRPADKLPAISGLAKCFFDRSNGALGNYVAGLWGTNLARQLAWRVDEPGGAFAFLVNPSSKSGRCNVDGMPRAPSWSWAAVDGPITLPGPLNSTLAKIVECQVQQASGHDEFGEVKSGVLLVRCPSIAAKISKSTLTHRGLHLFRLWIGARHNDRVWMDDRMEADQLCERNKADKEFRVHCVAIGGGQEKVGIILKAISADSFARVGCFIDGEDFFDLEMAQEKEFRII